MTGEVFVFSTTTHKKEKALAVCNCVCPAYLIMSLYSLLSIFESTMRQIVAVFKVNNNIIFIRVICHINRLYAMYYINIILNNHSDTL